MNVSYLINTMYQYTFCRCKVRVFESVTFFLLAEASKPIGISSGAPCHSNEMAAGGGRRGGHLRDRGGGQRPVGGVDGPGTNRLPQHTQHNGQQVRGEAILIGYQLWLSCLSLLSVVIIVEHVCWFIENDACLFL